jgi:hypothetical protein
MDKDFGKYILIASIASALVAVFSYFDNKKHRKIQEELMHLDKEIKNLQLEKAKNGVS